MKVSIEWRGTVSAPLRSEFEQNVRKTLFAFFKRYTGSINEIKLAAFRPVSTNIERLVRPAPPTANFGLNPVGYRATIVLNGSKSQGLICLMTIDNKTEAEVAAIIEAGPYHKKRGGAQRDGEEFEDSGFSQEAGSVVSSASEGGDVAVESAVETAVTSVGVEKIVSVPEVETEMSDAELLQYVAKILSDRKETVALLAESSQAEINLTNEVHDLVSKLATARANLAIVSAKVEANKAKLSEFHIPEAVKEKALAAKARLDASFGEWENS